MVATAAVAIFSVAPLQPSQAKLVAMVSAEGIRNSSACQCSSRINAMMTGKK